MASPDEMTVRLSRLEARVAKLESWAQTGSAPVQEALKGERVVVTDHMRQTARTLLESPKCDDKWSDLLSRMDKYDTISEKQKKFFSVIHKEITGSWYSESKTQASKPSPGTIVSSPSTSRTTFQPVYPEDELPF